MRYLFLFLISFSVFAGEIPYSVIGRGFYNKTENLSLQLACVGEFLPESTERKCDKLQFVTTDEKREQSLIGPVFKLSDPDAKIAKQLQPQFRVSGLGLDLTRQRKFAITRFFYGGGSRHVSGNVPEFLFAAGSFGAYKVYAALESAGVTFGLGSFALVSASFITFPMWMDVLTLPVTAIWDAIEGNNALGFRAKSIDVLQDRAKYSWQFKPKSISDKKFGHILKQLSASCKPKYSKSFYHKNQIVLLPKDNHHGYEFEGEYGILKPYWLKGEWQVKPLLKKDRKKSKMAHWNSWPTFSEEELDSMKPLCNEEVGTQKPIEEEKDQYPSTY